MSYLYLMGWNEILARVFEDFVTEKNTSPDWLINPATKRKLKLDYLFPEIGIAIRFTGMKARGQRRRKSDWEELEEKARNETRKELCRLHNIDLVLIHPADPFPAEQLKQLQISLDSARRRIAKAKKKKDQTHILEKLHRAHTQLETIRRHINKPEDLTLYAESWRDREAQAIAELQQAASTQPTRKINPNRLKIGQKVKHSHFGVGRVTAIDKDQDDTYITIDFVSKGERKFALSLLAGKLLVARTSS